MPTDADIRTAAFSWLDRMTHGGATPVTWKQLKAFRFQDETIQLIGASGIWKPKQLDLPISITTAPLKSGRPAPYDDQVTEDKLLRYRYRGSDPNHHQNIGLRRCFETQTPLVYLHGIEMGIYIATWPAVVVADYPSDLAIEVDLLGVDTSGERSPLDAHIDGRRQVHRLINERLGQAGFRADVLRAYRRRCAVCDLKHEQLLDAAHITSHADGGPSTVPNGLSLCKIHHAAFDTDIIGIDPAGIVHLRPDMLDEVDGPMLRHGLQAMHKQKLYVPRNHELRPNRGRLEQRWEQLKASS